MEKMQTMNDESVAFMIQQSEDKARRKSLLDGSHSHQSLLASYKSVSDRSILSNGMSASGVDSDHRPSDSYEKQREQVMKLADEETRKVNIWRRNVFFVVAVTAAFATAMTYVFLDRQDRNNFEQSFREFAQTIEESTEFNLRGLIESTNGLSQVLTSEAIKTGSEWPFVTLSSFEVYVRNTRAQGSSELVVVAPFVAPEQIEEWNTYSNANQDWIDESFREYETGRLDLNPIPSSLYRFGRFKGRTVLKPEDGLYTRFPSAPFWQMSRPPFDTSIINYNALSEESYQQSYDAMNISRHWVMGIAGPNTLIDYTISAEQHDALHSAQHSNMHGRIPSSEEELEPMLETLAEQQPEPEQQHGNHGQRRRAEESDQELHSGVGFANNHPHTQLLYPVFQSKDPTHPSGSDIHSPIVAMIVNILPWDNYLQRLLPNGVDGIVCILHNSAGQAFTYRIRGASAAYLGPGDLHDSKYDDMEYQIVFEDFLEGAVIPEEGADLYFSNALQYWFSVYPSDEFKSEYDTKTPVIFCVVVAFSFSFMTLTFILYDRFVTHKNNKILDAATHSNSILASLFPTNVKDRLLEEKANEVKAAAEAKKNRRKRRSPGVAAPTDEELQDFIDGVEHHETEQEILDTDPIADLFPEATVLFADLVGFTAWSSTREPTQVFILLETLYRNFDLIAKRRKVYKIETIGDCYVAVTGCPTPRKNHPVIMVRFCMECLRKMRKLTRKLESKLGPDTSSLDMRFGLHSGAVTGGVLRGERSRFQLFGDTMNTAARMESNGLPGRIHLSEATADLLRKHGKNRWLEMREEKIQAKGKGLMQTYWIHKISGGSSTADSDETLATSVSDDASVSGDGKVAIGVGESELQLDEKTYRVVEWTTQSLMGLLENVAASRKQPVTDEVEDVLPGIKKTNSMPLDELTEVLPFSEGAYIPEENDVLLGQSVEDQFEMFIGTIATKYRNNSFHSFFHASHVLQSFLKMYSTMCKHASGRQEMRNPDRLADRICTDPLTAFACAFACLVHDVDHPGIPNYLLKKEDARMASVYASRCLAEQNSIDIAWNLLNRPQFQKLRGAIVSTEEEAVRFRGILVNTVIATDLFDGLLNKQRRSRWNKAFTKERVEEPLEKATDRKATLTLEQMIQAADISHTMQHWSIYRKWNFNLFEEMYKAYIDGRSSKDPSEGWYQGELNFFDNHVIPLAERLVTCSCFGVAGDECLINAKQNRDEWTEKGHTIVAQMVSEVRSKGEGMALGHPKTAESVTSETTSKTTESGRTVASAGGQKDCLLAESERSDELSLSEAFQDELEVGMNGSVAC